MTAVADFATAEHGGGRRDICGAFRRNVRSNARTTVTHNHNRRKPGRANAQRGERCHASTDKAVPDKAVQPSGRAHEKSAAGLECKSGETTGRELTGTRECRELLEVWECRLRRKPCGRAVSKASCLFCCSGHCKAPEHGHSLARNHQLLRFDVAHLALLSDFSRYSRRVQCLSRRMLRSLFLLIIIRVVRSARILS